MPRFEPFAGLRYDTVLVAMDDVIAPPYDVVDEPMRADLASRSEYNAINVELPIDDPGSGRDRYQVAAGLLATWREKGVIVEDSQPCFYGYRMAWEGESGIERETVGVLGALGVMEEDRVSILPHEETMPKPKGDRLFLLRSTRCNISPIWGLSLASGLTALCRRDEDLDGGVVVARDGGGTSHSMWVISDHDRCAAIATRVASAPVVIADGHHRFETAVAYRAEQPTGPDGFTAGASGVMALMVELAPEQLHVRAINRLVSGLPAGTDVVGELTAGFAAQPYVGDPADLTPDLLVAEGAIALVCRDGALLLRDVQTVRRGGKSEDVLAELDSVRVRAMLSTLPEHDVDYEPRWPVALDAVRSGRADAAVMTRPVTVDQIGRAAHAGVRMPPKTTFFHPKPRTGMVFRPVG